MASLSRSWCRRSSPERIKPLNKEQQHTKKNKKKQKKKRKKKWKLEGKKKKKPRQKEKREREIGKEKGNMETWTTTRRKRNPQQAPPHWHNTTPHKTIFHGGHIFGLNTSRLESKPSQGKMLMESTTRSGMIDNTSIDYRFGGLELSSLDYDRVVYGLQEAIQLGNKQQPKHCAEKYKCKAFY